MTMTIGTPDWSKATVTGQVLLASVASGNISATVVVPLNIQTLVVFSTGPTIATSNELKCVGVTTTTEYPGSVRFPSPGINGYSVRAFPVAPVLDQSVILTWGSAPTVDWYVVGLSVVNVVDVPDLAPLVATNDAAQNGTGVVIMGLFNGLTHYVRVDGNSMLLVGKATNATGPTAIGVLATPVLAAPSGYLYQLHGYDVVSTAAATVKLEILDGATVVAYVDVPTTGLAGVNLHGFVAGAAITAVASAVDLTLTLRYGVFQ